MRALARIALASVLALSLAACKGSDSSEVCSTDNGTKPCLDTETSTSP